MDFESRNTDIEQHKSTIYIPTNSPLYDKVEKMVVNYSNKYEVFTNETWRIRGHYLIDRTKNRDYYEKKFYKIE